MSFREIIVTFHLFRGGWMRWLLTYFLALIQNKLRVNCDWLKVCSCLFGAPLRRTPTAIFTCTLKKTLFRSAATANRTLMTLIYIPLKRNLSQNFSASACVRACVCARACVCVLINWLNGVLRLFRQYFSHITATAHIIYVFPGHSPLLGWALKCLVQGHSNDDSFEH